MRLFNFFHKKREKEKKQNEIKDVKDSYARKYFYSAANSKYNRLASNETDKQQNDLLNSLNPLSPLWIGNNDSHCNHNQDNVNPPSTDFGGWDGGGAGASGSWDSSPSSSYNSSSYDSGSSSSYDSGSSSYDSGSSYDSSSSSSSSD